MRPRTVSRARLAACGPDVPGRCGTGRTETAAKPGPAGRRLAGSGPIDPAGAYRWSMSLRVRKRAVGWVSSASLVGSAVLAAGCGGHGPASPDASAAPRSAVPVESCDEGDAALVQDRNLAGALRAGPLVVYPADDIARMPRAARGGVIGPKVVVITTGAKPVTLTVGRAARARFSLLFAGATTGRPDFRVADGIAAVRFPACGRGPLGFRGGFLYRRAQCVPISVRADGGATLRATLAVGRPPASCPGALRPRSG
jgi:hypothetical protein